MSYFKALLFALLFTLPVRGEELLSTTTHFSYQLNKKISLHLPDQKAKWRIGWEQKPLLVEFMLEGEKINHWSELLTFQWLPNEGKEDLPCSAVVDIMIARFVADYGRDVNWRKVVEDDTSMLFEWWVNPNNSDHQHEIFKLFKEEDGYYRIAYTTKKSIWSDQEREIWRKALGESILIP